MQLGATPRILHLVTNMPGRLILLWALLTLSLTGAALSPSSDEGRGKWDTLVSSRWTEKALEPAFAQFADWVETWLETPAASRLPKDEARGLALAKQRQAALLTLMERDPELALQLAIPAALRAQMPPCVGMELEEHIDGFGDLLVTAHPLSRRLYWNGQYYSAQVCGALAASGTQYALPLRGITLGVRAALAECALERDTLSPRARLGGRILEFPDEQAVQEARRALLGAYVTHNPYAARQAFERLSGATALADGTGTSWSTGTKKVLIVRIDFSDKPGEPIGDNAETVFDLATVKRVMKDEVLPFYEKASYGKTRLEFTAPEKLYRVSKRFDYYAPVVMEKGEELWADAKAAVGSDYNYDDFDRVILLFTRIQTYPGWTYLGGKQIWINGGFSGTIVAHEIGHTYGAGHANHWAANTESPVDANASIIEYGDVYDIMGTGDITVTDFSPFFKTLFGWMPSNQVQTVTQSGTYRLQSFDFANASAAVSAQTLALKVGRSDTLSYWLSIRRNFDPELNISKGLYIQLQDKDSVAPNIVDTGVINGPATGAVYRPNSTSALSKTPALQPGKVLIDPANKIGFELIANGGTAPNTWADVRITYGNQAPAIHQAPATNTTVQNRWAGFSVGAQGIPEPSYRWQVLVPGASDWASLSDNSDTLLGTTTALLSIKAGGTITNLSQVRCLVSNSAGSTASAAATLYVSDNASSLLLFAGDASTTGSRDGAGSNARFSNPQSLALDKAGNLLVADAQNHVIRRVSNDGMVTTLAGRRGVAGTQDGGASDQLFFYPWRTAFNAKTGALIVSGLGDYVVRQLKADGTVSTLAGQAGAKGNTDGSSTEARFNIPYALAVDASGNVLVAEATTIRKISATGTVSTLAGKTGEDAYVDGPMAGARFNYIQGMALADDGSIYVSESQVSTIRRISPEGNVTTWVGKKNNSGLKDGSRSTALLVRPTCLALGKDGTLYFADGAQLRAVDKNDMVRTIITAVAEIRSIAVTQDRLVYLLCADGVIRSLLISGPVIQTQPAANSSVAAGSSLTLSVNAQGASTLSFQWYKDGNPIPGATGATLTLSNVQNANAGEYHVRISDNIGSTDSAYAVVNVVSAPVITSNPSPAWAALGSPVTLVVTASGTGPLTYQWKKNGVSIVGATNFSYTIGSLRNEDQGAYTCVVSGPGGTAESSAAQVKQIISGRLGALAVRSICGDGDKVLIVGYVLEGVAKKTLIVRGLGPNLERQGIPKGYIPDPCIRVFSLAGSEIAANDDWNGDPVLDFSWARLGAGSKDSAMTLASEPGVYSATVYDKQGGTGDAMIEIYDQNPEDTSARLSALSLRVQLDPDQTIMPGLIVAGSSPRRLIIRVLGPSLALMDKSLSVHPDPRLAVISNGQRILENDDWKNDCGSGIGLLAFPSGSKDAVIIADFAPGAYSLNVYGNGPKGGLVLVEIYEMP